MLRFTIKNLQICNKQKSNFPCLKNSNLKRLKFIKFFRIISSIRKRGLTKKKQNLKLFAVISQIQKIENKWRHNIQNKTKLKMKDCQFNRSNKQMIFFY